MTPQIGQTQRVQDFISYLFTCDTEKAEIVVDLYDLFNKTNSPFTDKFIYGGIGIYLGDELIGGIWVSKNHVSLVFSEGYKLTDKTKVLEGSGKYRRHIKLKTLDDISEKSCKEYINQLFELY